MLPAGGMTLHDNYVEYPQTPWLVLRVDLEQSCVMCLADGAWLWPELLAHVNRALIYRAASPLTKTANPTQLFPCALLLMRSGHFEAC